MWHRATGDPAYSNTIFLCRIGLYFRNRAAANTAAGCTGRFRLGVCPLAKAAFAAARRGKIAWTLIRICNCAILSRPVFPGPPQAGAGFGFRR